MSSADYFSTFTAASGHENEVIIDEIVLLSSFYLLVNYYLIFIGHRGIEASGPTLSHAVVKICLCVALIWTGPSLHKVENWQDLLFHLLFFACQF